ncbi:SctK family type III secretion system sorting platform protein [Burkholderia pyrrocinia]
MNDTRTRSDLKRMLWDLNVNVVGYTHPGWLKSSEISINSRRIRFSPSFAKLLIEQHRLTFVTANQLTDTLGRTVLLDVTDLCRLARWGAVLAVREEIRRCVFGSEIRRCIRVLGRTMIDQAIAFDRGIDLTLFDKFGKQSEARRLPQRLLAMQRRLIRAMCDSQPSAAAKRMRLRFRPGYFDRVAPLDGAGPLLQALLSVHEYADLSERAKCILAY